MVEVRYTNQKPEAAKYQALYKTTGWSYNFPMPDNSYRIALENSWACICAYRGEKLVGIGRLISDGALYAFVCDLIVVPEYQKQGIGSAILKKLKDICNKSRMKKVWLFAAPGKAPFYQRLGFVVRTDDKPGMELVE